MTAAPDRSAELLRFYTHALGCQLVEQVAGESVMLTLHGQSLLLERRAANDSDTSAEFRVQEPALGIVLDIDAWCDVEQRLREHGVATRISVPRPMGIGPGQQCIMRFSDPFGNEVTVRGFAGCQTRLAA